MADHVQDDIQDIVPERLPARLPSPFTRREQPERPSRASATAVAFVLDLSVLLLGGLFRFMISFQGFAQGSAQSGSLLVPKQISQTELLGGIAVAILLVVAVYAWWVRSMGTVLFQCVLVLAVLMITGTTVNGYSKSLPHTDTPSVQPTSTSTYVPCFSGSNGPGCN
jgi:hypothetical protein